MKAGQEFLATSIRVLCGIRPIPETELPAPPFVLFANHSSHLDFATIWAAVPPAIRVRVRPVAGRDYWEKTSARKWLAARVFHAVLIERQRVTVATNPLEPMLNALDAGYSLIVFPEGTRSPDGRLQPFKSGIYHLARARPAIPFVPVLLDNLNRILPKGEFLAVPLIASLAVGRPINFTGSESKAEFLAHAHQALGALEPSH